MRKWLALAASLATTLMSAQAATYNFTTGSTEFVLDHHNAYSWGISTPAGLKTDLTTNGLVITSAYIKINNIWNWDNKANILYINLLDDPRSGVRTVEDNSGDTLNGNFFDLADPRRSQTIEYERSELLTFWSDSDGGTATTDDLILNFTQAQRNLLASFLIDNVYSAYGDTDRVGFGLGFDPDCHYYNSGIEFCITTGGTPTQTSTVPDGGSTAAMLGLALLGAGAIHARLRKAQAAVA